MSTGRQPEPSLDPAFYAHQFDHLDQPMRSDDAEDAQDERGAAWNVDAPLERFRADGARGY